ncbi:unnamed protein product (macronuclear) [Paramecium tetraurelia]|uniref:Poly [ADP-ribose] polymerase n=1 Tax=Paramecium tetraurelia TaxID=5888 RepID=A0CA47_PARTE|nr:uncharacterized protein GSPATT00036444001 [Paramecium tetraurelia]CAK67664.1 unnamed protein product [Paramecium tetraurelia]|eukprot:XP_001435061.1 hypothetical protein (macronuclear) [Paramecium tetraurelia strain d4-2]
MPPKKATKKKTPSPSPPPAKRSTRSKKEDKVDDKKKDVVAKVTKGQSISKGKGKAKQKTPSPSPSPPPKKAPVRKDSKKSNKKSPSPQPKKTVKKSPSPAKKDEEQNLKKLVFTGKAPVDEFVNNRDNYVVYEDAAKVYDCMMNQTNIIGSNNNNKFYVVQLLKSKSSDTYFVFTRWGRVGVSGQQALQPCGGSLEAAKSGYEQKVRDKSVKGDYRILDKDYSINTDPKDAEKLEKLKEDREKESYDKSKLHTKIKELVRLIFDMKMINNQMKEIGYDAKKMPLGKLAASTINKGFDVLKKISEELNKKSHNTTTLQTLTSEFYSQIPHDFGREKAPVINTAQLVKQKLEMLESIQQIQVATKILEEQKDDDTNVIDENFKKLGINMQYLDPSEDKVKIVKEFVKNTHCDTHKNYDLDVLDVFELQKDQDDNRFKKDIGNRMLLWHGSRLTNFVGILSQGLRIAPPEAPVTGYMFGKGVYFADMVSKSANYCAVTRENNTGLILLCDVALGNTNEKFYSDYYANNLPPGKHSTWGKGKTMPPPAQNIPFPGMPEVQVPIGKGAPSGVANTSLLYNEFIVYDVAQIRLKYLIKMKWNYK